MHTKLYSSHHIQAEDDIFLTFKPELESDSQFINFLKLHIERSMSTGCVNLRLTVAEPGLHRATLLAV